MERDIWPARRPGPARGENDFRADGRGDASKSSRSSVAVGGGGALDRSRGGTLTGRPGAALLWGRRGCGVASAGFQVEAPRGEGVTKGWAAAATASSPLSKKERRPAVGVGVTMAGASGVAFCQAPAGPRGDRASSAVRGVMGGSAIRAPPAGVAPLAAPLRRNPASFFDVGGMGSSLSEWMALTGEALPMGSPPSQTTSASCSRAMAKGLPAGEGLPRPVARDTSASTSMPIEGIRRSIIDSVARLVTHRR